MATLEEENDWEHLNQTNWHGLGLTDPIKNVEVRPSDQKNISAQQQHMTIQLG
jgi:hypothetical protein